MTYTAPAPSPAQIKPRPLVLKERHEQILQAIYHYRFVTVTDITKLFFSFPSSYKYAGKMLSALAGGNDYVDRQYLYRFPKPDTRSGNSEKIYTLGALGRSYLKAMGRNTHWYFNTSSVREMSYQLCAHALTLTHFLVEAEIYSRRQENVKIYKVATEYEIRNLAQELTAAELTGKTGGDEPISVIPDAWLDFEHLKDGQHTRWCPVLLEIDRGNEFQESFKRHLLSRINFIKPDGQYRRLFGTNAVKVAYLTIGSAQHLNNMLAWTAAVLEEERKKNLTPLFHFCSHPKDEPFTDLLFTAPLWKRLDEKIPVSLLS